MPKSAKCGSRRCGNQQSTSGVYASKDNMRNLISAVFAIAAFRAEVYACSCGPPKPACAYLTADAIFLGRVSFSNDDRRAGLRQATLVRFEVEERFKGVDAKTQQVWIDPGSFTSCYKQYDVGKRYLIFATRASNIPVDSMAVTVLGGPSQIAKPDPPGFSRKNPPPVFSSPECSGSRQDDYPRLDVDLEMLRTYRNGGQLPRVIGHVYLWPYQGWPTMAGPRIAGARVKLHSGGTSLNATSDQQGRFTLSEAPAGIYGLVADSPPYRMATTEIFKIAPVGCGYVDVAMRTGSSVSGVVLDSAGKPIPDVTVRLTGSDKEWHTKVESSALITHTNHHGGFVIKGIPDQDLELSAGDSFPTTTMSYALTKYARTIRLKPGQQQTNILLKLKPLQKVSVTVSLKKRDGSPAAGAKVWAFNDTDAVAEQAVTNANGIARLDCLSGLNYNLKSFDYFPTQHPMSKVPLHCEAGKVVTYFVDELEAFSNQH